jgi:uncharacterized membrane protein YkoI
MKHFFIVILWMGLYPLATEAQEIEAAKVPAVVLAEFQKMYPDAAKTKWEMDDANYEASFKMDKKCWSAVFDKDGKFVESDVEIKVSELPQLVVQSIEKEFPGAKIEEPEKTTLSDGKTVYEFELEKDKKEFEVQISANGKIISKEESDDADEKGEDKD